MYLLLYVHVCVKRTGWKTRPRPKTVILPIKKSINQSIKWPGLNRVQITCNTSSAYHVHHVLRATWYEGTAQPLSLTELKSPVFSLYLIG